MTETYNTKCMLGLIMKLCIYLWKFQKVNKRPLYTTDYIDTFLCITIEVNVNISISMVHGSEYAILF